jgi:hypothetical protein
LIDGDRQLVEYIKEFRLVTIEHLEQLTGRATLWRRLRVKEPTAPLIAEKQVFFKKPRNRNLPYVFADHPIDRRSDDRLEHEILITDIHIALHSTGCLSYWAQGKEAWRGSVHQDAFAILQTERGSLHLFIEADTGSENHQQIAAKLQIYNNHTDKPFRLLFVTVAEARARNLARLAESFIPREERRYYAFTNSDRIKHDPLAPICFVPYETTPAAIAPGLASIEDATARPEVGGREASL